MRIFFIICLIFLIFYAIFNLQMSGCPPHPGICISLGLPENFCHPKQTTTIFKGEDFRVK